MPKKNANKSTPDWRELLNGRKSKPKSVSWRARARVVFVRIKYLLLAAAACAAAYGIYYMYANAFFDDFFGVGSKKIRHIEFKTDGVITPGWIGQFVSLPVATTLSDVNIFAVKSMLESLTQVKWARVERIYPDKLRIVISEHVPMARTEIKIDNRSVFYAISPEGAFYEPVCMNPDFLKRLPRLEGCRAEFEGRRPKPLSCAKQINEFLAYTQAKMPQMKWTDIDVSQIGSVAPLISAIDENGIKVIFAPKDYEKQFDRLDYVLKYSKENNYLQNIKQIDLSLKERADVKLRSQKK